MKLEHEYRHVSNAVKPEARVFWVRAGRASLGLSFERYIGVVLMKSSVRFLTRNRSYIENKETEEFYFQR